MKILLVNNYHYLRGGAERAYFDTARILREKGHEVAFFSTKNPNNQPTPWSKYFISAPDFSDPAISLFEKIRIVFRIFYNIQAKRNLEKLLKEFKPDVAHLHNIYHHLSPSIIDTLKKRGVPMVMTLHDYKLISPNYNLFANGKIWEASRPDKYWRCLADRCVQDSSAKSFLAAAESSFHKWLGIYQKIGAFISPSHFLRNKFKEYGFPKRIAYLPDPIFPEECGASLVSGDPVREKYILYFGRLSQEKGVKDLLAAYKRLKIEVGLKFIGTGPLEKELRREAEKINGRIEFTGRLEGDELWSRVRGATLVVVPSRWYENAPYAVIEAMVLGKIVLASRIGGLTELITDGKNGFLFEPGKIDQLCAKIEDILAHPEISEQIGVRASQDTLQRNDKEAYYQGLFSIYEALVRKK